MEKRPKQKQTREAAKIASLFKKKKTLNPAQYECMIDNMKKRIMQLQAQNSDLQKRLDSACDQIKGWEQLVKSMDAILYEIAVKYGEKNVPNEPANPDYVTWDIKIPKPDPAKIRQMQVTTVKKDEEYIIHVRSDALLDNFDRTMVAEEKPND